jgi:hypothetical protein
MDGVPVRGAAIGRLDLSVPADCQRDAHRRLPAGRGNEGSISVPAGNGGRFRPACYFSPGDNPEDTDGKDVFVYFNNDGHGHADRNAATLRHFLGQD